MPSSGRWLPLAMFSLCLYDREKQVWRSRRKPVLQWTGSSDQPISGTGT
jgi:hypothetical protein